MKSLKDKVLLVLFAFLNIDVIGFVLETGRRKQDPYKVVVRDVADLWIGFWFFEAEPSQMVVFYDPADVRVHDEVGIPYVEHCHVVAKEPNPELFYALWVYHEEQTEDHEPKVQEVDVGQADKEQDNKGKQVNPFE